MLYSFVLFQVSLFMFQQCEAHLESAVYKLLEEKVYVLRVKLDCTQVREQNYCGNVFVLLTVLQIHTIIFNFPFFWIIEILFTRLPGEMLVRVFFILHPLV